MELQKVNGQQDPSKKENMVKFVHDVAEMEIRANTLREMAKKIREEIQSQIWSQGSIHYLSHEDYLMDEKNNLRKQLKQEKDALEECNKESQRLEVYAKSTHDRKRHDFLYDSFWILLYLCILPYIIMLIIWEIFFREKTYNEAYEQHKEDFEKQKKKHRDNITDYENKIAKIEAEIEAEKDYCEYLKNDSPLALQAKHLDKKADEITQQLNFLYSIGCIPPDYCRTECVIVLDYVFRNDQADTMREATLLCDKALRHVEIMHGLKSIVSVLEEVAATMSGIQRTVESIKMNTDVISQDIAMLSEKMDDMNRMQAASIDQQSQLISETRGARYAAEAVQESNRKYEWYVDQHRRGLM